MIIDNPHVLRQVVCEGGAHPTHPGAESLITELAQALDEYAKEYRRVTDPLWPEQYEGARVLA